MDPKDFRRTAGLFEGVAAPQREAGEQGQAQQEQGPQPDRRGGAPASQEGREAEGRPGQSRGGPVGYGRNRARKHSTR